MDSSSLAIGVAGLLLQSFNAAVGCMDAIRNFREASDQNNILNCQLYIEQYNLTNWGRRCGLTEGLLDQYMPREETQAIALMIIRNMLDVISESETLRQKYGMSFVPAKDVDASHSAQGAFGSLVAKQISLPISNTMAALRSSPPQASPIRPSIVTPTGEEIFRQSIQKGKNAMTIMRKCQWVVADAKKFDELVKCLNYFNNSLDKLVEGKSYPLSTMEIEIVSNSSGSELDTLERAGISSGLHPELSSIATMRGRVLRSDPTQRDVVQTHPSRPQRRLRIELKQLEFRPVSPSGCQTRARAIFWPAHGHSLNVLVEWREFQSELTSMTREATIKRAEGLAIILQNRPKRVGQDVFRILGCVGYYITDETVGYVFEMPQNANPEEDPVSLLDMLDNDEPPEDTEERPPEQIDSPPLQQRFELMQILCKSIWWLHCGDVVHKGIRSENVIFFKHYGNNAVHINEPYITGFDHSRPDGPSDVTITQVALRPAEELYRHPAAQSSMSRRSTKIHDLYSLGLVLMEIAHWVKLEDLIKKENRSYLERYLFSEYGPVEDIDHLMGTRVKDLISRCLRGNFDVQSEEEGFSGTLQAVVLKDIVGELMKCSV